MRLLTLSARRGSVVPETGGDGGKQLGEAVEKRTESRMHASATGLPGSILSVGRENRRRRSWWRQRLGSGRPESPAGATAVAAGRSSSSVRVRVSEEGEQGGGSKGRRGRSTRALKQQGGSGSEAGEEDMAAWWHWHHAVGAGYRDEEGKTPETPWHHFFNYRKVQQQLWRFKLRLLNIFINPTKIHVAS